MTIIATAEWLTIADRAPQLGIRIAGGDAVESADKHTVDMKAVNGRLRELVKKQSHDIEARMWNPQPNVRTTPSANHRPPMPHPP